MEIKKPADLAEYVYHHFKKDDVDTEEVPLQTLVDLFECLFYTSLHSEEGSYINVTITFHNPKFGDQRQTKRKALPEQWSFYPFEVPLPLEVGTLVKLAKAADPWSSTISIYHDSKDKLLINGLTDQALHQQSYLNLEEDAHPGQPGIFQVLITGIGTLTVMSGFELVGTLKQDTLITKYLNVFGTGPVADIIKSIIEGIDQEVRQVFLNRGDVPEFIDENLGSAKIIVRNTLSRLLNKIKSYKHGGAILITDDSVNLDTKYKLEYERIRKSIINCKINQTEINFESTENDEYFDESAKLRSLRDRKRLLTKELKGAIRFVASLSRVDGLILLNKKLVVKGFGVVIRQKNIPTVVYVSSTITASDRSLRTKQTEHFGTRHRTMFAYCFNHPGSLGIVISQDGDIRAITRIGERLIMWENLQILKNR